MQINGELERIQMMPCTGTSSSGQSSPMKGPPPNGMAPADQVEISSKGQMMSYISGLSDEEKTEVFDYLKEATEAIQAGTYDAEEMASTAPEQLTAYAEENGLDLEEFITSLAQNTPPQEIDGKLGFGMQSGARDEYSAMKFQNLYQQISVNL
jgi:hypothetical protein